jgi:hypothetical protein
MMVPLNLVRISVAALVASNVTTLVIPADADAKVRIRYRSHGNSDHRQSQPASQQPA